ncbi:MAG: hypothetical protein M3R63_18335 [Actinomycetota bacterium]|nr:hypothetical protein [Actinomycetota bacterium]
MAPEPARTPHPRRLLIVRLVALAIGLAALGGIVWHISTLGGGTKDVATTTLDYDQVCSGDGIDAAAEYRPGAGPHPVMVFDADRDGEGNDVGIPVSFVEADRAVWDPLELAVVQLVACAERVVETDEVVTTCAFNEAPAVPMRRATIEVTVYQARTAAQVGEPIMLPGLGTDCPFLVSYSESSDPELFTTATAQQYLDALRATVQG